MTKRAAQDRSFRFCAALVFAACSSGPADTGVSPSDTPPSITSASATCDLAEATWRFAIETDAWTGNGQVLLSTDGVYVEKHPIYSKSAAPDGSADSLSLTLSVTPDWRDVVLGSSTVFNCREADLTGILRVWTRDGDDVSDCRAFGTAPERWATWSAGPTCDTVLEPS